MTVSSRAITPSLVGPPRRTLARALALALALGVALAACGKRGPPEAPEGEPDRLRQVYPAPESYGPAG